MAAAPQAACPWPGGTRAMSGLAEVANDQQVAMIIAI